MCIQFGSPCVSIGFRPFTRQILKLIGKLASPDSFDRQHMIVTALAVGSF